jgi:hypothetical protein
MELIKSCDNCYWKFGEPNSEFCAIQKEEPAEHVCSEHNFGCEGCKADFGYVEEAIGVYRGVAYCEACCLDEISIKRIPYVAHQYYRDGDFLGDSSDVDAIDLISDSGLVELL